MQVFDDDYDYFLTLLKARLKKNIELHAYYLMPNHFHLLIVPRGENSLSRFMQWVISHVLCHKKTKLQSRFKSFIVEQEGVII
ncbi:hypothetical protein [uncultured Gammaproteobacteria bacterium]|nr:hypothetical protein [uncultured Gammaproteobacteria bacterium]